MSRQSKDREKIFANHMYVEFVSRVSEELLEFNKKNISQFLNGHIKVTR